MRALLPAAALLVAACGRRDPAPPPVPPAAPAPASPFTMPPPAGDPAERVVRVRSLLPEMDESEVSDGDPDDERGPWQPRDVEFAGVPAPFSSARALLDGLDVEWSEDGGDVAFDGPDADLAGRVLAAAHVGTSRSARVEIAALRLVPGAAPPTAEAALAARGPVVIARADRVVRDGALVDLDERTSAAFPADVSIDDNAVHASSWTFSIGARLVFGPVRVDAAGSTLRVAFHDSRVVSERLFSGDEVERVAPSVAFASLLFEAPASAGVAAIAVADSGDPRTSFVLAWRVTPRPAPATPQGTLAERDPRDLPEWFAVEAPRVGVLPDASGPRDEPIAPPSSFRARVEVRDRDALRAARLPSGLVVLSGDERELATVDEARRAMVRESAARFREAATAIPFIRGRPLALVQGRLDPAALRQESAVAQAAAFGATHTAWVLSGRSISVTPRAGGAVVWSESAADPPAIVPGRVAMTRRLGDTYRSAEDAFDEVRIAPRFRTAVLAPGAPAGDGPALEAWTW